VKKKRKKKENRGGISGKKKKTEGENLRKKKKRASLGRRRSQVTSGLQGNKEIQGGGNARGLRKTPGGYEGGKGRVGNIRFTTALHMLTPNDVQCRMTPPQTRG